MNAKDQLAALSDLAEELGMELRRAPAGESDHPGGAVVRLKGRSIVFLDESASPAERIAVLAGALSQRAEIADMFLPPALRELIDSQSGEGRAGERG